MRQVSAEDRRPCLALSFWGRKPKPHANWTEQPCVCRDVIAPVGTAALRGHSTPLSLCSFVRRLAFLIRNVLKLNFRS